MREIEFKAKRVDNGEWVYGFLSDIDEITVYNEDYLVGYYTMDAYNIIPETVWQWTGLLDKQGVKIFEGDIFQYHKHDGYWFDDFIGVIGFKDGCFGYDIITEQSDISNEFHPFSYHDELKEDFLDHIEVIGNIHDKAHQKQRLIDMMRWDEEIGLYDDNPKNHGCDR